MNLVATLLCYIDESLNNAYRGEHNHSIITDCNFSRNNFTSAALLASLALVTEHVAVAAAPRFSLFRVICI